MSEIHYAIEINTESSYTSAAAGMQDGYLRVVTDRPIYTGTDTGSATIPVGDNSVLKVTITNGAETLAVAIQSGELYTPSNVVDTHTFKAANTVLNVGDRFCVTSTGDTSDTKLNTAKGGAPAEGDMFEITNNGSGTETISYVGENLWYEDFITKDGMSNPSRRVDLTGTGGYGAVSGFNFQIDNSIIAGTDTPLWSTYNSNSVYFINKEVRVYAVIDHVFYQIWTGIVDNMPRTDTDMKFVCKSNYKQVHKSLPDSTINKRDYPNASDEFSGSALPVCFGDVEYANMINTNGAVSFVTLVISNGVSSNVAMGSSHSTGAFYPVVTLHTEGVSFGANDTDLVGSYLFVIAGTNADTELGIRINGNDATSSSETILDLAADMPTWASTYDYNNAETTAGTWQFKVAKMGTESIISSRPIVSLKTKDGLPQVYQYNSDTLLYDDVRYIYNDSDATATPATMEFLATSLDKDGEFKGYYSLPIEPSSLVRFATNGTADYAGVIGNITDYDRSTFVSVKLDGQAGDGEETAGFLVRYKIADDVSLKDIDKLWIAFDTSYDITPGGAAIGDYKITYRIEFYDQYNREASVYQIDENIPDAGYYITIPGNELNLIPNEYYKAATSGSGADSENDHFSYELGDYGRFNNLQVIDGDLLEQIKSGAFNGQMKITVNVYDKSVTNGTSSEIKLNQIAIIAERGIDIISDSLYTRVSGEYLADLATETNTVYNSFRHILEDFDSLATNKIDYGNMATTRHDWYVGRQVKEKKNSFEYLSELAGDSFVQIFQNRRGKVALSAWRDRTDTALTHNDTTIIKGSINNWRLTGIDKMFNAFNIKYSENPGGDKYFSQYLIKDTDTVGQGPNNEIEGDQLLWDVCKAAYDNYKVVKELTRELKWYNDRTRWYNSEDTGRVGQGSDSSAYKFLYDAVFWLTRQKREVTYNLPMNTTNAVMELCDPVSFNDPIYTNDSAVTGSVSLIEYDLKSDQIKVMSVVDPQDTIDTDYGYIIETGSASDTITESGSQSDTIEEGA